MMLVSLGLSPILATGCAVAPLALPAAAGIGTLAYTDYRDGEYVLSVEADRAACEMALCRTAEHFALDIVAWEPGQTSTAVTLRDARGDRFRFWLADVGQDQVAVYIRAGLWGDDLCSRQLASDLVRNLPRPQGPSCMGPRRLSIVPLARPRPARAQTEENLYAPNAEHEAR